MYHLLYRQQGSLNAAERYPSPDSRGLSQEAFLNRLRGLYEAEIRYCDHQLGRFFDALWADSMWDDTLVLVTADHGEEFLDHGYVAHHVITGLAEELIHIPAVLKPPGWKARGKTIGELVRMVDFAPTILDYTGLSAKGASMDGVSLRPLIEGRKMAPLTAFFSTIPFGVVRDARWKYRYVKSPEDGGQPRELLFDISSDPLENYDVAALHPGVVADMRARYSEFVNSLASRAPAVPVSPGSAAGDMDFEEKERLEALGYVNQ